MSTIMLQIGLGPEGEPPTEFRLFKLGSNATSKGAFKLDDKGMAEVLAAFEAHGMDKMPIDFNHGMVQGPQGNPRAAGWADLEARADGLWAVNVEWTPAAFQALKDREFRFVSPAFKRDGAGRIVAIANVALTNLPATKDAPPLVAHDVADVANQAPDKGTEINPMSEKLFKLLGAADEGEALVIATGINTLSKSLLKATGAETLDDAMSAIEASKAKVVTLTNEVAAMKKASEDSEREALIDKLSTGDDAKFAPATRETLLTMTIPQIEALAATLPSLGKAAAPAGTPPATDTITLSDEDKYAMAQFGIDSDEDKAEWMAIRREEIAAKKAQG